MHFSVQYVSILLTYWTDIQYAIQMKALAMGGEHVGGSAAFILNSQCIMHLTATQKALVWMCEWTNFHFGTFLLYNYVTVNDWIKSVLLLKCHGSGLILEYGNTDLYYNFDHPWKKILAVLNPDIIKIFNHLQWCSS